MIGDSFFRKERELLPQSRESFSRSFKQDVSSPFPNGK
jgi:hypothetical protein